MGIWHDTVELWLDTKEYNMVQYIVGIPPDQSKSNMEENNLFIKSCILENKSDSLWYWDLYHTHLKKKTYLKYEQMKQVKLRQVCWIIHSVKCVFWYKLVILKYHSSCFNELTFKRHIFSLIKLLTIFFAVFMSLLMILNSIKYKSKYPNIICWIMSCIMQDLWNIKWHNDT